MKSIKHHLLGLLLATCAAVSASASPTQFTDMFFVPGDMSGPGTLQTFSFGGGDSSALAGDTFIYDFLFNTPPPTAWFGFQVSADDPAALAFSDIALFAGDLMTPMADFALSLSGSTAGGYGILDSGVYDVRLSGNFLADGATFTGVGAADLADLADVPEPMSLALFFAGLLAVAAVRRRSSAPRAPCL
jgi:hypothetical protein